MIINNKSKEVIVLLLKCPECELPVSDRAMICPHCGYPLKPRETTIKQKAGNKRRRLPNGFGQISEIKGKNLRNPFRVMVPVGKQENGRPICKLLKPQAYFKTYNDAYSALMEYNKNPYELESTLSVRELYEKWSNEYFKTLKSQTSIRTITSAWNYCSEIYDMRAADIRARHIKGVIENGTANINGEIHYPSPGIKSRIKSLFNMMLDYGLEYEIVDKNYARTFNVSSEVIDEQERSKRAHMPFTSEEMSILWSNVNTVPWVDAVLIQCYSGWRPQELGLIKIENIDLEKWVFVGGMKTSAGIDRLVPIHSRIRGLVQKRYDEAVQIGSEYLFNCTDTKTHRSSYKLTYDKYQHRFIKLRDQLHLNPEHRPHDGRKHFVTAAKKTKVDEYAIKYIVGHAITDITEKVYTEREVSWLQEEIEKIK